MWSCRTVIIIIIATVIDDRAERVRLLWFFRKTLNIWIIIWSNQLVNENRNNESNLPSAMIDYMAELWIETLMVCAKVAAEKFAMTWTNETASQNAQCGTDQPYNNDLLKVARNANRNLAYANCCGAVLQLFSNAVITIVIVWPDTFRSNRMPCFSFVLKNCSSTCCRLTQNLDTVLQTHSSAQLSHNFPSRRLFVRVCLCIFSMFACECVGLGFKFQSQRRSLRCGYAVERANEHDSAARQKINGLAASMQALVKLVVSLSVRSSRGVCAKCTERTNARQTGKGTTHVVLVVVLFALRQRDERCKWAACATGAQLCAKTRRGNNCTKKNVHTRGVGWELAFGSRWCICQTRWYDWVK